jgi:large subunit ribosomal protein L29
MKIDELRSMSEAELNQAAINASEDMFRMRFQHHTGQLTRTSSLQETRHTIARIKTLQAQKAAEQAREVGDE